MTKVLQHSAWYIVSIKALHTNFKDVESECIFFARMEKENHKKNLQLKICRPDNLVCFGDMLFSIQDRRCLGVFFKVIAEMGSF